jgi:hypothetical protein
MLEVDVLLLSTEVEVVLNVDVGKVADVCKS